VAWRIGVFGTESGSKRINGTERHRTELAFELSGNRQVRLPAEKILRIINFSFLRPGHIVHIQCGHLEHGAGTLGIGSRDDGRVEIVESPVVEELVNGIRHVVTHAKNGSKRVCPRAQVSDLPQELQRVTLLLQRIRCRICRSVDFNPGCLDLHRLSLPLRLHQLAVHIQAGPGGDGFKVFFTKLGYIYDYLYIIYGRPII